MAAVVLQANCTPEDEEAMIREILTGECEFDQSISGLRLRPVVFASRKCVGKEVHWHSSVGELATGRWAMDKFRIYLWIREFTWITDCSGIIKFYDMDLMPTHQVQRWKLDML